MHHKRFSSVHELQAVRKCDVRSRRMNGRGEVGHGTSGVRDEITYLPRSLIRSIVRDRSFIKSQRWEVQFSKRLDFGGSILKMHKM